MDERALFTRFWENESKTTRNVIARIPEGSDYRPDPKSRTASEIAWQIACEEKMIIEALESGKAEWKPPPAPSTMKALLDIYEKQSADIVGRWKALPAARWDGTLEFFGSQRPASPMAWSFLFDIVHHRGQLSTYLRPMGSTVPQIYGPSGDEP
jgi:uncharacterized damage-inducible protein DinB